MTPSFVSSRDKSLTMGDVNYYGAINDIIEVEYWGVFNIVLFKCIWFQEEKDDYRFTKVNLKKTCYAGEP